MKLLLTGLSGTLAPRVATAATRAGHEVIGWDRARASTDDPSACRRWLEAAAPDAIGHLAPGPVAWAAVLATHARGAGLAMVVTSTAMVFHHEPDGPHAPGHACTAQDDYGRYKIACEDAVRTACASACIARIGWQIDADGRGNNMLAHLDRWQARDGRIGASRLWRPACSFMDDTAEALLDVLQRRQAGTVHLDSNAQAGHTFDAIAAALAQRFARTDWRIAPNDDYRHDQRLVGHEALMPPLSDRLPL